MTDKQWSVCIAEAQNYSDKDAYVSDLAASAIWGDAPDAEIPPDRIATIGDIWDACHRSVKEIAASAGISVRSLAIRFCIPQRTMEDWASGRRECKLYDRLMMQELLGLLNR